MWVGRNRRWRYEGGGFVVVRLGFPKCVGSRLRLPHEREGYVW